MFNITLSSETKAGIYLTVATILAILFKNSSYHTAYDSLMDLNILSIMPSLPHLSFLEFINDGLMSIFFFTVSLELKRELYCGHLSHVKNRLLPAIAAFGGMVVPAIVYLIITRNHPEFAMGATIPVATDIAFAVSLFQIAASHVPYSLKISLLSLAIFDDLGSIILIALLYSQKINLFFVALSMLPLGALVCFQYQKMKDLRLYSLASLCLWLCFMPSGLHPTLSGVLAAFCIPIDSDSTSCVLSKFEKLLHYWVSFLILPLFAFCNGGIVLGGFSEKVLLHPVTMGCMFGLALGKPIGVMLSSYLSIKAKICELPEEVSWIQYFGMSLLTGVGFTMSLFLGILAFPGNTLLHTCVRLGVLLGTTLSSSLGILLFQTLKFTRSALDITPEQREQQLDIEGANSTSSA